MKILRVTQWVGLVGVMFLLGGCVEPDGFTVADVSGDEWVSEEEFERYMLEIIFTDADGDGDAEVTFAEWKVANPSGERWKFRAPDRNGDEVIDPGELREHFAKQGTMRDLFRQIDTDGNGYLSREEVAAFKAKVNSAAGSTRLEKLSNAAKEGS
jgi:Ca2+-binding EF-hand superfamily protein